MQKILYIDDDEHICMAAQRVLSEVAKVDVANSGGAGIELVRVQPKKYGLIITDLKMPRMNGLEVLAELQKMYLSPFPPRWICTGTPYQGLEQAIRERDGQGYKEKPWNNARLQQWAREQLQNAARSGEKMPR